MKTAPEPSAAALEKLRRMPEFRALQQVCAALLPLEPEGRRKVIEAVHALMKISAGVRPSGAPRRRR